MSGVSAAESPEYFGYDGYLLVNILEDSAEGYQGSAVFCFIGIIGYHYLGWIWFRALDKMGLGWRRSHSVFEDDITYFNWR